MDTFLRDRMMNLLSAFREGRLAQAIPDARGTKQVVGRSSF